MTTATATPTVMATPTTTHPTTLMSTSDALITFSDHILHQIDNLQKVEYNKKGRKYRFVNNTFKGFVKKINI